MKKRRAREAWSRRRWAATMAAGLLLVALVAGVVLWNSSRAPQEQATDRVRAARTDETTTVSLAGILAPQQQANVSFAVPGTVQGIDVKVGDAVTAGQLLARIDERDLRNALSLAQAQAAAARAQLQTVRDAARSTSAQVAAARAQVESADASVAQARGRLADASLTSPLTGVVAAVNIEVGDQVSGASGVAAGSLTGLTGVTGSSGMSGLPGLAGLGSPGGTSGAGTSSAAGANIVVVVPNAWKLEAEVGTADLPSLKPGQEAVVTPTGTSQHVAAVVDTVGIVATATSGQAATFPVTLTVTDASAVLFSGANADAVVVTGRVADVLTIPGEALWITNGKPTVRREQGSGVRVVEVTTGRRFGDRVEITSGLGEGDEVLARRSVVVSAPPRPQFGPNGTLASPDPTATAGR